jgi:hypothetical protein
MMMAKEYFGTIEINYDGDEEDIFHIADVLESLEIDGITINWCRTDYPECQEDEDEDDEE